MSGRKRGGGQQGDGGGYGGPPRQQGGFRQGGSGPQGQNPRQGGPWQPRGPRGPQQHGGPGQYGQSGQQGHQPRHGGQWQPRGPRGPQQGGPDQPAYHQRQQFRQGPRHEQGPGPRGPSPRGPRQYQDRPRDEGFQQHSSGGFPAPAWGSGPEPTPQEAPVQSAPAAWGSRPEPVTQQAPVQYAPAQPSSAAPVETQPKGKGKGRGKQTEQAAPTPAPAVPSTPAAEDNSQPIPAEAKPGKKKQKGKSQDQKSTQPAAPSPSTSEVGDVVKKTKDLTLQFDLPKRMVEVVHKGKPHCQNTLLIEVNYLPLKIKDPKLKIYHYDVNFNPERPKYLLRDALEQIRQRHFNNRHPAFDGMKNMYVAGRPLNEQNIRDTVTVYNSETGRDKEFDVTIKLANSNLNLEKIFEYCKGGITSNIPQTEIQAMDIALRSRLTNHFTPVGRSFFANPAPDHGKDLGGGMELWHGFYQSAIPAWKPYLNIDVANKAFPIEQEVLEFIRYDLQYEDFDRGLDPRTLERLKKFIKGLKISYKIPNPDKSAPVQRRVYKVTGLGGTPIQERFKPKDDGPLVTVGEYYQREKQYTIKYPRLPLLTIGTKGSMVPIECCSIVGNQAVMRKLDEKQTAEMVKAAARPTTERKDRIYESINKAKYNNNPTLKEFGIEVQTSFEKVEAVVIKPPSIQYKMRETGVQNGVWRLDRDHFLNAQHIPPWVVLNLNSRTPPQRIEELQRLMMSTGKNLGMNVPPPQQFVTHNGWARENDIIKYLNDFARKDVRLVIVVLSNSPEIYGQVKRASELRTGVLTQCIKAFTVERKMNPMTATNILLKVNAKLTGVNHSLAPGFTPQILKDNKCMLVGADVTHPAPGSEGSPSIAAVAASQDDYGFQYKMLYRLQPSREEMILELAEMMKEQLEHYIRKWGYPPKKILYFRDGVSEGQFQQVLNAELLAIRRSCKMIRQDYEPGITFLVVQKRHHTRFFPNPRDVNDRKNCNVPAGTLVDKQITHPTEIDFYLVSHQSIQGTARPTKYHLLWDDSNIPQVDLEILTYYLCHMFSRCTRSVSYPAPTYYAHLAAFRARAWWDNWEPNMAALRSEQEGRGKIVDNMLNTYPMFFT